MTQLPTLYERIDPTILKKINEEKTSVFSKQADLEHALVHKRHITDLTVEQAFHLFQAVYPDTKFNLTDLFKIFCYEKKSKKIV